MNKSKCWTCSPIVVSVLKAPLGRNNHDKMVLDDFVELFDAGIVIGGDMTTEAAYCKLLYLLGKFPKGKNNNAIKHEMSVNLRGELSTSMHVAQVNRITINMKDVSQEVSIFRFAYPYENNMLTNVTIRLKALKIIQGFDNKELKIDIYFDADKKHHLASINESIEERTSSLSYNFDISTEKSTLFPPDENFSLWLVSPNHTVQLDSISVVAFVKH